MEWSADPQCFQSLWAPERSAKSHKVLSYHNGASLRECWVTCSLMRAYARDNLGSDKCTFKASDKSIHLSDDTTKENSAYATLPSMTATHEFVVPRSIPIISLPDAPFTALRLHCKQVVSLFTLHVCQRMQVQHFKQVNDDNT